MRKILARANRQITVGWAAAVLASSFFISALLGLLRERLLLANFGLGPVLDSYYIAFSVPDFIFYLLISGALSVTFIPVLSEHLAKSNKKDAWELSSSLLNLLGLLTLGASILIMIFAPIFTHLIAGGASPEVQSRAADLMRIVAVNPFLFGISSVLASMQQAMGRFFFNAFSPVLYNLGIITGIMFLAPRFGIKGVALGVGIGAIAQLLIQILGMAGLGFEYRKIIHFHGAGLRKVLRTLPARSFDQSIDHLMAIVERFLASFLFAGAIAAYQTAFNLRNVPITLIGAAIATAAFPKMSALASTSPSAFKTQFINAFRTILWLSMPAAAIAFIMRGYLVRLLLGSGSQVVAVLLGWLSISIIFRALFQISTRAFYANQDTKTPLLISIAALVLNVVLAVILVNTLGLPGLALAQTAIAGFELLLLVIMLQRKFGRLFDLKLVKESLLMLVATAAMSLITYSFVSKIFTLRAVDVGFFTLVPKFGLIVVASGISYLIFSSALGLKEAKPIIDALTKFIFKPVKIESSK